MAQEIFRRCLNESRRTGVLENDVVDDCLKTLINDMTAQELKKIIFYLDGLKYSFQMGNLASRRIRETLDEIARCYSKDEYTEEQITSALLDAWILVDVCFRVRQLIQQTPGLSPKLPGLQIFLRGTKSVDQLRNYVQHFRSGIPKIPDLSNPLWGSLSWISSNDKTICFTIFSGNLVGGVSGNTLTFDIHNSQFTAETKLLADGIEIDLLSISEQLKKVKICISGWIDQQPHFKRDKNDGKTLVWSFRYIKSPVVAV